MPSLMLGRDQQHSDLSSPLCTRTQGRVTPTSTCLGQTPTSGSCGNAGRRAGGPRCKAERIGACFPIAPGK